jgi:hypothetical protein
MRLAWFCVLALLACLVQHGVLATWWWAPDLPLALAAWAMVDGDEDGVPLRAGLVGLIRDVVDPGSLCFHVLVLSAAACAFLFLRPLLFRGRALAWGLWAALLTTVVLGLDLLISGPGDLRPATAPLVVVGTALTTMLLGWLLAGLPGWLRPVARAGA